MRILCVAREGAYETSHEPPTADPHGGWCGGWGLEASGYPIRHRLGAWSESRLKEVVHEIDTVFSIFFENRLWMSKDDAFLRALVAEIDKVPDLTKLSGYLQGK